MRAGEPNDSPPNECCPRENYAVEQAAGSGLAGMKKMQLVAASARDKARKSQEEVAGLFQGKKLGGKLRGVTKGLLGHHETGGKPNFISRNASLETLESAEGPKDSPRKNEAGDDDDETDDGQTGAFDDTTTIVRRRNSKYRLLDATPAVFAQACYFDALLGRNYGRRSDVILKMMEKEFESCGISTIHCRRVLLSCVSRCLGNCLGEGVPVCLQIVPGT